MYRPPNYFPIGINMYVPAMAGSAELTMTQPQPFTLGKPAAASATAVTGASPINLQGTVGTVIGITLWIADSTYGRVLSYKPSGDPGNANVIDILGTDYLGQPMTERITGTNGSSSAIAGKKAFYRVTGARPATASVNAVTLGIGTGTALGMPYKSILAYAKEAGVGVILQDFPVKMSQPRNAAGANVFTATAPGSVDKVVIMPTPDTPPNVVVKVNGIAVPVNVAADGTVTPKTNGDALPNTFQAGATIEVTSDVGDSIDLYAASTQVTAPDLTDPATATTGDPRGTYNPITAANGTNEYIVGLFGDPSVNAAGNGGLMGIRQFYS